jgi:hypothetical protein
MPISPPSTVPHRWHEIPPVPDPAVLRTARRRRRLYLLLAAAGILLGVLAGMLTWLQPFTAPVLLPLWITEYRDPRFPVSAEADHDRAALEEGDYFRESSTTTFGSQERQSLSQELAALARMAPSESVVVFLSAFAAADEVGQVVVFPADANPEDPGSPLRLRTVLETLRACPARYKLLVLDIMRPLADPRLGVLANDAADRVAADVEAVPDPSRRVLCACSPGQVALTSENLGRSVFGYYFDEALRGWADGYNPQDRSEGRVAVGELVEFVRRRVDRWAQRSRDTRQTPLLLGSGPDFPLAALPHDRPRAPIPLATLPAYPDWLLKGWQLRDRWRSGPDIPRLVPLAYRTLRDALMRAEQQWRGGRDPARVRRDLEEHVGVASAAWELGQRWLAEGSLATPTAYRSLETSLLRAGRQWAEGRDVGRALKDFEEQLALIMQAPGAPPALPPAANSLGLAAALGNRPDAELATLVRRLLAAVLQAQAPGHTPQEAEKARLAAQAEFVEKCKGKSDFQVADAVFAAAAGEEGSRPPGIRFLNTLLAQVQPRPLFMETLLLRQLANLVESSGPAAQDRRLARALRRALEVADLARAVAGQPRPFPWLRRPLDEAAQQWHEGKVILFARGYAPLEQAEMAFDRAAQAYSRVHSYGQVIEAAYAALDRAPTFLTGYLPYLVHAPRLEPTWQAAVRAAGELHPLCTPPPDGRAPSTPELRRHIEALRQAAAALDAPIEELHRPFSRENLAEILDQCSRSDSDPEVHREALAILATPFLQAADRKALWEGATACARRREEVVFEADRHDDRAGRLTRPPPDFTRLQPLWQEAERQRGLLRARVALALFGLAGLDAEWLDPLRRELEQVSRDGAPVTGLAVLGAHIRQAWHGRLRAQFEAQENLHKRDWLAHFLAPRDLVEIMDSRLMDQVCQERLRPMRTLQAWLAERAHYESHDLLCAATSPDGELADPGWPASSGLRTVQFLGGPGGVALGAASPFGVYPLRFGISPPAGERGTAGRPSDATDFGLRILTPDDAWLQVTPNRADVQTVADALRQAPSGLLLTPYTVALRVALQPGAALSAVPPPLGFLVEVELDGRAYHLKVPVTFGATTERLDLLLAGGPGAETVPLPAELRLRPLKGRQPFDLYVRNGDGKPRNVLVELNAGKAATAKLTAPANGIQQVVFGQAAPAAGADLPALEGPLQFRLLDPDRRNEVLEVRPVRVAIADPREYVQVTDIRFDPPDPARGTKNRLTVRLRARRPLSGPPCQVELVLPPREIPGFIAARDGNFRGTLPADGGELLLYADNIQLSETADEEGWVYLTVDGVERAFRFRTTFVRYGDPTWPREDQRPALDVRAERYARPSPAWSFVALVDDPPPGASLEVGIGRFQDRAFFPDLLHRLPHARRRYLGFSPQGPGGTLLFEAILQDWTVTLDTSGLLGRRELLVRLLDAAGNEVRRVRQAVTFDGSPPGGVAFVGLPKKAWQKQPLTVQAVGGDPESGIQQVQFFLGRPVQDKPPPGAQTFAGQPQPGYPPTWTAQIPPQPGRTGPTDVTVQFVNGVGLSAFATASVDLTETDPRAAAAAPTGPTGIRGTVLEGPLLQPGLEVTLDSGQGKAQQVATTAADGSFVFKDLAPGLYKVLVAKPGSGRKAEASVSVEAHKMAEVQLELSVLPPSNNP